MPDKVAARRANTGEFVQIEGQHVELADSGVLKIGVLSVNLRHRGKAGVIGFDSYCCKNDFSDCVPSKGGQNCADTDRPITVWKFAE